MNQWRSPSEFLRSVKFVCMFSVSWLQKALAFSLSLSLVPQIDSEVQKKLTHITNIVTIIYISIPVKPRFKTHLVHVAELLAAHDNRRHLTVHNYWNASQRIGNHWLLKIQKIPVQKPLHKSIAFAGTQVSWPNTWDVGVLSHVLNYCRSIWCCVVFV